MAWTALPLSALLMSTVLFAAVSVGALAFATAQSGNPLALAWQGYYGKLEEDLRRVHIRNRGRRVAVMQIAAAAALALGFALSGYPLVLVGVVLALIGPRLYVSRLKSQHTRAIDEQVEAFLIALGNALKATPSLGNAFLSVRELLPAPISLEIAQAEKELRLGSSIEDVLLAMSTRVDSPRLDTGISALLIGRQVGGDLGGVLDSTASAIREMDRLEGVVRSKTAEGKFQMYVLIAGPLAIVGMLELMKPGYFAPLMADWKGWVAIGIAMTLWTGALLVARKVLKVDL